MPVPRRTSALVITIVAIAVLVVLSIREAWVCDDALIAFRYVRNFVAGNGLVFNTGERVEAFSSFSFVLLLAPFHALQLDLFEVSIVVGILATALEAALIVWLLARRQAPLYAIALAAGLFATDRITAVWATGGLETATYGALIMLALALQLERPRALGKLAVLHAVIAASRPEGIVLFPIWLAHLVITKRTSDLRRAVNVFVPLIVILLAARLLYYGELAANPYRAKVTGVPTLQLGIGYSLWFLRRMGLYGVTALGIVPLIACVARSWRAGLQWRAPLSLAIAIVVVQLVVVVAMGGDYMTDFRFFRPILGPFYVAIGCLVAIAWDKRTMALIATAIFVAGHVVRQLDPVPIFDDAPPPAQHKAILTIERDKPAMFAAALARFANLGDSLVADWGGYMSYGHDLRTIDCTGLVSSNLSRDFYLRAERSETGARERLPGHARWPTIEMMQREHFTFIFPKVNDKPPERPEIDETMPQRSRDYPFLHVTVPLGDGRFLRFFTTLDAAEIAARARAKALRVCFRPGFGELTCVDGTRS